MVRFSILVCDDSTVARKQVIRCLNECIDADIQQATNGKEALEQLHHGQFDLVCLDLTMPEVDGIAVLEQVKANKIESYVLVISADIHASNGVIHVINSVILPPSTMQTARIEKINKMMESQPSAAGKVVGTWEEKQQYIIQTNL